MTEEKQIEEMAKDLQKSEHWRFDDNSVDFELDRKRTAKNLYNKGYRKAEDVAREIFEELEERIAVHTYTSKSEDYDEGALDVLEWVDEKIDELKKKYESEEKNNGTDN